MIRTLAGKRRDEDCDTGVQVEVNLGARSKVAPDVLQAVIDRKPDQLPANLCPVYQFVEALVEKNGADEEGLVEVPDQR
mgnify:CR=1 FL=1